MQGISRIIAPQAASKADLHSFHAASYLDCLATANEYVSSDEIADDYLTEELEQHGIGMSLVHCIHITFASVLYDVSLNVREILFGI